MSDYNYASLRALLAAVTSRAPLPWEDHQATNGDSSDGPTLIRVSDAERKPVADLADFSREGGFSAALIASAVNALPGLIDAASASAPPAPLPEALATTSPFQAVTAMLKAHDGMDPANATCLGCGAVFAEAPLGSWPEMAAEFARHQWDALGFTAPSAAPEVGPDGVHAYVIEVLSNPGSINEHWVTWSDEFQRSDQREEAVAERDLLIGDGHHPDHVRVVGLVAQ